MPDPPDPTAPEPTPDAERSPGWGVRKLGHWLRLRRLSPPPAPPAEESSTDANLPPPTLREVLSELKERARRQEVFLEQIRNHFLPQAIASRERRLFQVIKWTTIRVSMSGVGILLSWDFGLWYYQRYRTRVEASEYASVATAMYEQEANPGVALALLDQAVALDSRNADYRYQRAYIQGMAAVRELLNLDRPMNKAELDRAHTALGQAMLLYRVDPTRPESFILQGQLYTALKDYDKAAEQLQQALRMAPDHAFARVRLGVLFCEQGKTTEGLQLIEQAVASRPDSKWGWLWQGIELAKLEGRTADAREAYLRASAIDDKFDLADYNLAWTYMQATPPDYPRARTLLERAIRHNPCYKEAYYALGMLYGYQNQYETARVYLDKAIALDDQFLTAFKWRGIVQCELEEYEPALEDFARAIELDPRQPELYLRRARANTELGRLGPTMTDLRFALELDPKDHRAWLNLGNAYLKANELDRACESYTHAIEIKPDYDEAFGQLAAARIQQQKYDEALAALDRALTLASYRPERWHLRRAQLYALRHDAEQALKDFTRARELDAELREAWLGEAQALAELGRIDEALKALDHAIALQPDDADAQALHARLSAAQPAHDEHTATP